MVSACIIITEADGQHTFVVKEFTAFADDLYRLKAWLLNYGCRVTAMESTSVYWRPVHNVLEEGSFKQKVGELFRAIEGFFNIRNDSNK